MADDVAVSILGDGSSRSLSWFRRGESHRYEVRSDWMTLRDDDHKATASIFYTSYTLGETVDSSRPVTFLFNGGPGAASAFLHLGTAGPKRVAFNDDGTVPPMPVRLVDNEESWLEHTDLVFVDPVGSGFSRAVIPEKGKDDKGEASGKERKKASEEFWEVGKDLESLSEFIRRYLSEQGRWLSPIFLAGESYGGYRVARLARLLQGMESGVGLSGVLLISPALEFDGLIGTDYDVLHWVETLPSMAAAAHRHGRAGEGRRLAEHLAEAEDFVEGEFLSLLVQGESMDRARRERLVGRMAGLVGLAPEFIDARAGRISREAFARELLRDQGLYCGLHDASVSGIDPFPDRESFQGPDPVMEGQFSLFTMGINACLRSDIGVKTELEYRLFSPEAHMAWKNKQAEHLFEMQLSSLDDLRFGMAANPHLRVLICYGYFDLVTPYYEARRLERLMKLSDAQKSQLSTSYFVGGHMFYTYSESRQDLADRVGALVTGRAEQLE